MTVQELIEELEELDPLTAVLIESCVGNFIYDEDDIEFIDEETLALSVKHYEVESKNGIKNRCLLVTIDD